MRTKAFSTVLLSLLAASSTVALAADLPSRVAPPVYVPPPLPVFTWTGFFAGANAGAAFDQRRSAFGDNAFYFPAGSIAGSSGTNGVLSLNGRRFDNNNRISFTGGGQIGYNYQLGGLGGFGGFGPNGGIVIGVVADAQYLNQRGGLASSFSGTDYTFRGAPGNAFVRVPGLPRTVVLVNRGVNGSNDDFFGTVRGRLGAAFDRVLVYGTGGFAYNTRATGYAAGGGLEFAITNNVTIGAEYLYVNLDRSTFAATSGATYTPSPRLGAGTLALNQRFGGGRDSFSVARAVVNYKFNAFAVPPVVARY